MFPQFIPLPAGLPETVVYDFHQLGLEQMLAKGLQQGETGAQSLVDCFGKMLSDSDWRKEHPKTAHTMFAGFYRQFTHLDCESPLAQGLVQVAKAFMLSHHQLPFCNQMRERQVSFAGACPGMEKLRVNDLCLAVSPILFRHLHDSRFGGTVVDRRTLHPTQPDVLRRLLATLHTGQLPLCTGKEVDDYLAYRSEARFYELVEHLDVLALSIFKKKIVNQLSHLSDQQLCELIEIFHPHTTDYESCLLEKQLVDEAFKRATGELCKIKNRKRLFWREALPKLDSYYTVCKIEIGTSWKRQTFTHFLGLVKLKIAYITVVGLPFKNLGNIFSEFYCLSSLRIENASKLQTADLCRRQDELPCLQEVFFVNCPKLEDISSLLLLKRLKTVGLIQCPKAATTAFERALRVAILRAQDVEVLFDS